MRTIERFAWIFGILNLLRGLMGMFSPFVDTRRGKGVERFLPANRRQGLINRRPGQLIGGMGAISPPQAYMHTALGAMGLATRPASRLSRPYMILAGVLFAALAVMGWASTGTRPGLHKVNGLALDWRSNLLHSILGGTALLLAARPELGQRKYKGELPDPLIVE